MIPVVLSLSATPDDLIADLDQALAEVAAQAPAAHMPTMMDSPGEQGLADPARFFERSQTDLYLGLLFHFGPLRSRWRGPRCGLHLFLWHAGGAGDRSG